MAVRVSLRVRHDSPPSLSAQRMERLALADRHALGLRFGEPCDPRRLVELHDVERIVESFTEHAVLFRERVDDVAAMFAGLDEWSSLTFAIGPCTLMMLVNPCHSVARRTFSIAHEFGHLVLGHQSVSLDRLNGSFVHSRYSDVQEFEAYSYALALLIPYAPLLQFLEAGASHQAIADHYRVSLEALQMRLKLAGLWRGK
jgi:hypothetical protein